MRCLYCGKELALLKRLTKGSEFCSEAHRTKYQEEFNDLALNRLLQSRSAGDAEATPPEPLVEEPETVIEAAPPAKLAPIAVAPAVERRGSPKAVPVSRRPAIAAVQAKPAPKPQEKDEVVGMTGWIILSPDLQEPGPAAIVGGEPPILEEDTDPVLPWRSVKVQQVAREYGLKWANPVSWTPPVEGSNKPVRPMERNVEVRDFSRQANPPVLQQVRKRHHSQEIAPSGAAGEAMDITNQPRQPAGPPVLWQAGPQPASALEPVLGEFARLDFPTTGFNEGTSSQPQPKQSIPVTAPAPLPQPAAAAPPPVPVPAIVKEVPPPAPAATAPAPPATQPLPLTLQGLSASPAKPAVAASALPTATQPQTPAPTALPLRPTVVLGPAVPAQSVQPQPPQPKPAPAGQPPATQAKPPVSSTQLRQTAPPSAPVIKPVAPTVTQPVQPPPQAKSEPVPPKPAEEAPKPQNNQKGKKPEVRIIPTAPTQTAPQPQAAAPKPVATPPQGPRPVAAPQPGPRPVAQPAAKSPVPIAPEKTSRPALVETKPEAKAESKPQPQAKSDVKPVPAKAETKPQPKAEPKTESKAEAKHVGPRSTLISADVADTPAPISSKKAVDLGLPELHTMEEGGFWAKLPGGVKIAVAAVLVIAIFGFAFMTLNGSSATAKVVPTGPTYELGRPMNTNGWIENWTPNDNNRRVTLLRGSQNSVDYRMQFNAQIQSKAVGWMFRGLNPRNFYVGKIEKSKPGSDYGAMFVRYAVIDGRNEARVEKPLDLKVHVGTIYQIKFEAIGPNFKVWVQGNLADEWTDKRIGSGGLGLYSEKDEVGIIQGDVNAYELVAKEAGK